MCMKAEIDEYHIRPLARGSSAELQTVEELAQRAGMPVIWPGI